MFTFHIPPSFTPCSRTTIDNPPLLFQVALISVFYHRQSCAVPIKFNPMGNLLSTAAIAGIAAGGATLILVTGCLITFTVLRLRHKKHKRYSNPLGGLLHVNENYVGVQTPQKARHRPYSITPSNLKGRWGMSTPSNRSSIFRRSKMLRRPRTSIVYMSPMGVKTPSSSLKSPVKRVKASATVIEPPMTPILEQRTAESTPNLPSAPKQVHPPAMDPTALFHSPSPGNTPSSGLKPLPLFMRSVSGNDMQSYPDHTWQRGAFRTDNLGLIDEAGHTSKLRRSRSLQGQSIGHVPSLSLPDPPKDDGAAGRLKVPKRRIGLSPSRKSTESLSSVNSSILDRGKSPSLASTGVTSFSYPAPRLRNDERSHATSDEAKSELQRLQREISSALSLSLVSKNTTPVKNVSVTCANVANTNRDLVSPTKGQRRKSMVPGFEMPKMSSLTNSGVTPLRETSGNSSLACRGPQASAPVLISSEPFHWDLDANQQAHTSRPLSTVVQQDGQKCQSYHRISFILPVNDPSFESTVETNGNPTMVIRNQPAPAILAPRPTHPTALRPPSTSTFFPQINFSAPACIDPKSPSPTPSSPLNSHPPNTPSPIDTPTRKPPSRRRSRNSTSLAQFHTSLHPTLLSAPNIPRTPSPNNFSSAISNMNDTPLESVLSVRWPKPPGTQSRTPRGPRPLLGKSSRASRSSNGLSLSPLRNEVTASVPRMLDIAASLRSERSSTCVEWGDRERSEKDVSLGSEARTSGLEDFAASTRDLDHGFSTPCRETIARPHRPACDLEAAFAAVRDSYAETLSPGVDLGAFGAFRQSRGSWGAEMGCRGWEEPQHAGIGSDRDPQEGLGWWERDERWEAGEPLRRESRLAPWRDSRDSRGSGRVGVIGEERERWATARGGGGDGGGQARGGRLGRFCMRSVFDGVRLSFPDGFYGV